jgi:Xaa-Pro dipeptidase
MSKHDFPPEEFAARKKRVREAIGAAGLDWMVLFHPVSIHWLTGSDAKSYQAFQCLLVAADDRPLVMVVRESERPEIEADTLVERVVGWGGPEPEDPLAAFSRVAGDLGLASARVGMEVPAYYLHPYHYVRLKDLLGEALVAEPSDLVHRLKLVKSPRELQYIRDAGAIADRAMQAFADNLARGRSELELTGEVYRVLLGSEGGLPASTLNLVSGERSAFSHGAPTERRLETGDFGNIEFGGVRRRYTATIGRQFSIGKPTARMLELYEIVREASEACRREMRDGVPAIVPHEAAKKVIAAAGLDRYRVHTTGYGLAPGFPPSWGEPVNMFGGSKDVLKAGMVLSVEPPVFIGEEKLGARLIDNVLVTETGTELIARFPPDLIVVE